MSCQKAAAGRDKQIVNLFMCVTHNMNAQSLQNHENPENHATKVTSSNGLTDLKMNDWFQGVCAHARLFRS